MAGVKMPEDRIVTQPATGFCRNAECRENGREFNFQIEHDNFACPKCGANRQPMIGVLTLTHLLIRHPKGPIYGSGGLRWAIVCDQARAYLASASNNEAATDDANVANCPGCLDNARKLGIKLPQPWAFKPAA